VTCSPASTPGTLLAMVTSSAMATSGSRSTPSAPDPHLLLDRRGGVDRRVRVGPPERLEHGEETHAVVEGFPGHVVAEQLRRLAHGDDIARLDALANGIAREPEVDARVLDRRIDPVLGVLNRLTANIDAPSTIAKRLISRGLYVQVRQCPNGYCLVPIRLSEVISGKQINFFVLIQPNQ